ncbi:hypothetical protein K438DRAFT_1594822, partial [Mycena galopus ATCC 62051]
MQTVNSLTSKLQTGSPMACLYILNNPDHYTNCSFKLCWWRNYVDEVKRSLEEEIYHKDSNDVSSTHDDRDLNLPTEKVVLMSEQGKYVGATNVDDYVYRPSACESYSMFDFVRVATRVRRSMKQQ